MSGALRGILVLLLAPVALVALGYVAYMPRSSPRVARAEAVRQLPFVLDEGERVAATTPAVRRPWWRYFHPVTGVLAATDRRLVWVGVAPRAVIEWSGTEPPPFEIAAWPYDSAVVTPTRVMLGVSRGLAVRDAPGGAATRFAVGAADAGTRQAVVATLERRQAEMREAAERERQEQERLAWLARQPVYHTVAAGEAVSSIAERYGLTPDSLRALNELTSDRIRVGQVLLVKPGS